MHKAVNRASAKVCLLRQGKNVFLRDAEPFIKWLEEAEEDEDEE